MLLPLVVKFALAVASRIGYLWENSEAAGLVLYNNARTVTNYMGALTFESRFAAEKVIVAFNALQISQYTSEIFKLAVGEEEGMRAIGGGEGDEFPDWEFDFDFEKGEYKYDATLDFDSPFFIHVHPAPIDDEDLFKSGECRYDERRGDTMPGGVTSALLCAILVYNTFKIGFYSFSLATSILGTVGRPLRFFLRRLRNDDALQQLRREVQQLRNENAELRHIIKSNNIKITSTEDDMEKNVVQASSSYPEGNTAQAVGVTGSELGENADQVTGRALKHRKLSRLDKVGEYLDPDHAVPTMPGVSPCDEEFEEWNSGEVLNDETLEAQLQKWDINDSLNGDELGEVDRELEDWKPEPIQVVSTGPDLQEMFRRWYLEEALDAEKPRLGETDVALENWKPEPIQVVSTGPDLQEMFRKWYLGGALDAEELRETDMALENWKPEPIQVVSTGLGLQEMIRKWYLGEALSGEELEDDDAATLRVDILEGKEEEGVTLRDLTLSGDAFDFKKLKDDEFSEYMAGRLRQVREGKINSQAYTPSPPLSGTAAS